MEISKVSNSSKLFPLMKSLFNSLISRVSLINCHHICFKIQGYQYRSVDCTWGGKPCLEFESGKEQQQAFCNEPNIRDLFPKRINYRYVLQCSQFHQKWQLCYNDYCKATGHECKAVGDRKFR